MAFFRLEDQEVYDIDNCVHKGEKVLLLEDEVIVGYTGFIDIGNFLFDDLERKTALMHVNSDIHLDFRIKDDYQGKGYGMLLLTKTIEEVKKSGFDA